MALRRIALLVCLVELLFLEGNSQSDTCAAQRTCGTCIATPGCTWCSTNGFTNTRCIPRGANTTCTPANIEDPIGRVGEIRTGDSSNPVTTSNVNLELRVGEPQTVEISVTPLPNLPLDLYVLIDLSTSMGDELTAFTGVAGRIAERIAEITSNVQLGFGSFNDKFTRPFSRMLVSDDNFVFWHRVTLTTDTTLYSSEVTRVTGTTDNVDQPENGLEGLAQVITCEDVIGWRRQEGDGPPVTRVVLYMTDEAFHYAGEGQLAGIVNPYNGKCLIDAPPDGGAVNFTRWNEFDYPSIGQIVDLLAEREVVTIFAVSRPTEPSDMGRITTYENLAELIRLKYRASVAELESNETAILDLINTEISRILQEVFLIPDSSSDLDFNIQAMCPTGANLTRMGMGCDNVALSRTVNFTINVTLLNCDDPTTREHRVRVPSFGEFTITYTPLCNCSCEENAVPNSPDCNNQGSFTCGVCECNDGYCGEMCATPIGNRSANDCPRGGVSNELCSGLDRGSCDCFCQCSTFDDKRAIFGPACECDNFRCSDDGQPEEVVCSGRGVCCEAQCRCRNSSLGNLYRGNDCECEPEVEVCVDPNGDGSVCSGRGSCGCQSCERCTGGFTGPYCNIREEELQCQFLDHQICISSCAGPRNPGPDVCNTTVTCNVNRSPTILFRDMETIDGFQSDGARNTFIFDAVNTHLNTSGVDMFDMLNECSFINDTCMYMYYLVTNQRDDVALVVERPPVCSSVDPGFQLQIPPYAIAIIILAILLILGILILALIKIIFLILDAVEYRRWKRELDKADFSKNQNPLYQSPEMKYENVAYGKE